MLLRQVARGLQELHRWNNATHVAHNRLQNRAGDALAMFAEGFLQSANVVVLQDQCVLTGAGCHTGRIGYGQRRGRTAGGNQQAVDVPVVVSCELDNHIPAGVPAGQADGAHRRLGTGADQAHLFDRRYGLDNQLGQFVFRLGRRAEAGRPFQRFADGIQHCRVLVTQDHGPPGTDVVDVPVPVHVEQISAVRAAEDDWLAAYGPKRPCGAVDATGDQLLGAGENLVAFRTGHGYLR